MTAPTCTHHWLLDAPNGPVTRGVCRKCGASRDFANSQAQFQPRRRRTPAASQIVILPRAEQEDWKARMDVAHQTIGWNGLEG